MSKFKELKKILKNLAKEIHKNKIGFKDHQRKNNGCAGKFNSLVWNAQYEFRHKHIAYCTLRGTPRDKIEKPAEDNKPNEEYIEKLIEEYSSARTDAIENVRTGS